MSNRSLFVISLDFELYWGMFDKVTLTAYGDNILGVHTAIPEMLHLFSKYQIHATWATVGMLLCENKTELYASLPEKAAQPNYPDKRVSAYEHIAHAPIGDNEHEDPYHFGGSLARAIAQTPLQELGSHTFSHYYCIDGKDNAKGVFEADCTAFTTIAKKYTSKCTAIVFPRNQTTDAALAVCTQNGFTAYRGTPEHFLYTAKSEARQTNRFLRALRLIDAYINISGHHTYPLSSVYANKEIADVAGSRFLRPYSSRLRLLEPLRIARIKRSMTYAAKHGEVFHLWWHPHNFGSNRKENLQNLISILEHFTVLQQQYGMQSATMSEAAEVAARLAFE